MSNTNKYLEEPNLIEAIIEYSETLALGPPDAPEWADLELLADHLNTLFEARNEELEALRQHQAVIAAQRISLASELEKLQNLPDPVLQFWQIIDCRQWRAEQVPEDDLEEVNGTTTTLIKTLHRYEITENLKAHTLQQRQKIRSARDQLEKQFNECMEHLDKVFREVTDDDELDPGKNNGSTEVEEDKRVAEDQLLSIGQNGEEKVIPEKLQIEDDLVEITEIFPTGMALGSIDIYNEGAATEEIPLDSNKANESLEAVLVEEESFDDMDGWLIAVHTLRGGLGSTSIAVNLAIGLQKLWGYPTLLMDNDFVSGQVALMLNSSARRNWADFGATTDGKFDNDALAASISIYDNGLHFLAAPANSAQWVDVDQWTVKSVSQALRKKYSYLVSDLTHDFSNVTLEVLKAADRILLVLSPDIVAVRLAAKALRGYGENNLLSNKVQLVLVHNSAKSLLKQNEIEKALNHSISHVIPYGPKATGRAIASGVPFLVQDPKIPVSISVEDLAYFSSKPIHQENPPLKPSNTWKRVLNRQNSPTDDDRKLKLQLPFFRNLRDKSKVTSNLEPQDIDEGSP
jgi:Flp pilus assembly CpaE family ATPase